jgi:hypothetical protein
LAPARDNRFLFFALRLPISSPPNEIPQQDAEHRGPYNCAGASDPGKPDGEGASVNDDLRRPDSGAAFRPLSAIFLDTSKPHRFLTENDTDLLPRGRAGA